MCECTQLQTLTKSPVEEACALRADTIVSSKLAFIIDVVDVVASHLKIHLTEESCADWIVRNSVIETQVVQNIAALGQNAVVELSAELLRLIVYKGRNRVSVGVGRDFH